MQGIEVRYLIGEAPCTECQGKGIFVHPAWADWSQEYAHDVELGKQNMPTDLLGKIPQFIGCGLCEGTGKAQTNLGMEIETPLTTIEVRETEKGTLVLVLPKEGTSLLHSHDKDSVFYTKTEKVICFVQEGATSKPVEDEGIDFGQQY